MRTCVQGKSTQALVAPGNLKADEAVGEKEATSRGTRMDKV